MSHPRPWVKFMEASPSTFPQTYTLFVPNPKGVVQTALTWNANVFAAAAEKENSGELKI